MELSSVFEPETEGQKAWVECLEAIQKESESMSETMKEIEGIDLPCEEKNYQKGFFISGH